MWCEEKVSKITGKTTYKFIERYKCPYSNKLKKVSVTYAKNNKQAEKAAFATLQEMIQSILNEEHFCTKNLDDLIKEYLLYRRPFVKITTYHGYKQMTRLVLKVFPEGILIGNITSAMLQKIINDLLQKYSYGYTKDLFSFIRQLLKYARRMEYIKSLDFLEKVELQKPPKTVDAVKKERSKFLTKSELIDLLARIKKIHPYVALVCEFQSLTGLRIGELLALRPQDYDKKNKVIDINGTLSSIGSFKNADNRLSPKNVYSIRNVALDERANQIINFFISLNKQRKFASYKFHDYNYIFVTDGGLPFDLHFINKIIKKTGYHKPVSTHTFRHTHISMLAEANVPLKAIMERVGHNEPRTTLSIYTHVTDEMAKEVDTAINTIGQKISTKKA